MEATAKDSAPMGSRHLILKKSFKAALRSMLTACSKEDFSKAFAGFTSAQQDLLYRMFTAVIASAHGNIENEFESLCQEIQVGNTLDAVEQAIEEQNLDPLASHKTNIVTVKQELSAMKKNEIRTLTEMLEKAEDEKQKLEARIEKLCKGTTDS